MPPGKVNDSTGGAPPGFMKPGCAPWNPGVFPGSPGVFPGSPGVFPGSPGVVPGRPGGVCGVVGGVPGKPGTPWNGGGFPGVTGGVPGKVGVSPGRFAPGGTVLVKPVTGFVRAGNRLVIPGTELVRNRLVRPRFVGGAGFVPTIGVGGNSGAASLNCPLKVACPNAPVPATKVSKPIEVLMRSLSTGCAHETALEMGLHASPLKRPGW